MIVGYREDGACWKDKRQWTQAGTREILTRYKFLKKNNSHESGQTPEHVPQRGCGISILREIQNPPGHSPEQPPPAEHALRRRLDRRHPGVPSNHCSSIMLNSDDQQSISKSN